jgi:hypothetical protein
MKTNPALVNSTFQGYKLSDTKLQVTHCALPLPLHINYHSTTYTILEYLIKWNHVQKYREFLVYFDNDLALNFFNTNTKDSTVVFHFPSSKDFLFAPALVIVNDYFLVSTGQEDKVYFLQVKKTGMELVGFWDSSYLNFTHPATILDAKILNGRMYCLMLGTKDTGNERKPGIAISLFSSSLETFHVEPIGTIIGEKTPHFAAIQMNGTFSVLCDSSFRLEELGDPMEESSHVEIPTANKSYIWTQTDEDVTIHFTISEAHAKQEFTVCIQNEQFLVHSNKVGNVMEGKLFDDILPHESTWTLEEHLHFTLYFAKKNKRCRWTHVFAEDDGVLETLDTGIIGEYSDRLSKYTGAQEGSVMTEMLAMTEQAEMIDFSDSCSLATFSFQSGRIELFDQTLGSGLQWLCPVNSSDSKFVCKADVDGAVFELKDTETINIEIFAALGYIRASKREASLIAVSEELDYCAIAESKRYLYIYANPQGESTAVHYVIDLWEGDGPISNSLIIGLSLEPKGLWIMKEDSLVRVDF